MTTGLTALIAVATVGFRSLEGGAKAFTPPQPSSGGWDHEDYFGPGDERPNEPSIFMPNFVAPTPAADTTAE